MWNIEGIDHLRSVVPDVQGLRVCELGNQRIWVHAMKCFGIPYEVAADWFVNEGAIEYVSIDTNNEDGALPLNLAMPINTPELQDHFDLVTDIGTMEHVDSGGPVKQVLKEQLNCLNNIHRLCAPGGLMLHQLPPIGQWGDHCRVRYYDSLPQILCQLNGYHLVQARRWNLASLGGHVDYLAFTLQMPKDKRPFTRNLTTLAGTIEISV